MGNVSGPAKLKRTGAFAPNAAAALASAAPHESEFRINMRLKVRAAPAPVKRVMPDGYGLGRLCTRKKRVEELTLVATVFVVVAPRFCQAFKERLVLDCSW